MGIKTFTSTFPPTQGVSYKNLVRMITAFLQQSGTNMADDSKTSAESKTRLTLDRDTPTARCALDAMNHIHQALACKSISRITDESGRPTAHILVVLSVIKKLTELGIDMIWVFDHNKDQSRKEGKEHLNIKEKELQHRKSRREKTKKDIEKLKQKRDSILKKQAVCLADEESLFSDSDMSSATTDVSISPSKRAMTDDLKSIDDCIDQKSRQTLVVDTKIINEVKFILDALNVAWVEAPLNVEGEQLGAWLTQLDEPDGNKFGKCDAIITNDADALLYGAQTVLKRHRVKSNNPTAKAKEKGGDAVSHGKKKRTPKIDFDVYNLHALLEEHTLTHQDLVKIGIILGSDFAAKTPGVGPKSVLKKFKTIQLTDEQQSAANHFLTAPSMDNVVFHNIESRDNDTIFAEHQKLHDWLISKQFTNERWLNFPSINSC